MPGPPDKGKSRKRRRSSNSDIEVIDERGRPVARVEPLETSEVARVTEVARLQKLVQKLEQEVKFLRTNLVSQKLQFARRISECTTQNSCSAAWSKKPRERFWTLSK
ncbi:uncharacterized protein LOC134821114 [Bolinopsis microptera]|uniref:uncharacterized protein LOC134821114 n=1 Tax=Bolinopsis microptera TaxID=2820187 RepID=UPI00307AA9A9